MARPRSPITGDFLVNVARGYVPGAYRNLKYGASQAGIQTTPTDLWGLSDSTPTQQIWLAPTAARIHTIASDSAEDDTGQTGVASVKVYYLPDWDTTEQTETVAGDINAGQAMTNAAVMINRMKVIPQATTTGVGGNIGTITATAAAPDNTITAAILPGDGQTEQCILGIPSIETFYMTMFAGDMAKSSGSAAHVSYTLRVNENPDVQTLAFLRKGDAPTQSTGSNTNQKVFSPPRVFPGPCIIKVQGVASKADVDGDAQFNGWIE